MLRLGYGPHFQEQSVLLHYLRYPQTSSRLPHRQIEVHPGERLRRSKTLSRLFDICLRYNARAFSHRHRLSQNHVRNDKIPKRYICSAGDQLSQGKWLDRIFEQAANNGSRQQLQILAMGTPFKQLFYFVRGRIKTKSALYSLQSGRRRTRGTSGRLSLLECSFLAQADN